MAFTLDLLYSQSNDATTLTVTDDANTYHAVDNPTGWETGGATNPDPADIVISTDTTAGKHHLLLTITVTDKNNTTTVYDTLNLWDHAKVLDSTFTGFTDASDLTWAINPSHLIASSTAMGDSDDRLDDGIYNMVYTLQDANSGVAVDSLDEDTLVDGDVRYDVYNKLRDVSSIHYLNELTDTSREVMEALLAYTYLQALEASAAVALTEEIINMLYTLDKLVSDGSSYTW